MKASGLCPHTRTTIQRTGRQPMVVICATKEAAAEVIMLLLGPYALLPRTDYRIADPQSGDTPITITRTLSVERLAQLRAAIEKIPDTIIQ